MNSIQIALFGVVGTLLALQFKSQNIAVQIEIFTKLTILAIGMPVLLALLELIGDFLI